MTEEFPSVSAVVTAYNSERYIADAISSIRAQSRLPDEIIIVDDGSSDATRSVVEGLGGGLRYMYQSNRGEGAARNAGIAASRCDFIAFLDADDAWLPDRQETLLTSLGHPQSSLIVSGKGRLLKEEHWWEALEPAPHRLEGFMMSFGASLIARKVFERIGPVDETLRHGVDLDWFLRCREAGVPISVCDAVCLLYRRHEANMSNNLVQGRQAMIDVMRASIKRRRLAGSDGHLPKWENLGRDKIKS